MVELVGWLGYVEPVATAVAAVVAIYAAVDARMSAARQSKETERQAQIALEAMLIDYHATIVIWAGECIDQMAWAISLTFLDPEKTDGESFFNRRAQCISYLSALIDRGRLFFPNEAPDKYGLHKPEAFRGFTPVVLDQLKYVHDQVKELRSVRPNAKSPEGLRAEIVKCKRQFVTEVQRVVDPRARESRLKKILLASSTNQAIEIATKE